MMTRRERVAISVGALVSMVLILAVVVWIRWPARVQSQASPFSDDWWLVVAVVSPPLPQELVAKGWPREFEYLHQITAFSSRERCEAGRQEESERARAITQTIGPHYVVSVSACRHALMRRDRP